jgi:hypothetical protein
MLVALVEHYITHHRPVVELYLEWFRSHPTMKDAITSAALAQDCHGKRFLHQWRLRKGSLRSAERILLKHAKSLEACQSFQELHDKVEDRLKDTKWLGELYVYDVSLRLGAKLDIYPELVYLHAGTRVGAACFNPEWKSRKDWSAIEVNDLPPPLRELQPFELEDFLCCGMDCDQWLKRVGIYPPKSSWGREAA